MTEPTGDQPAHGEASGALPTVHIVGLGPGGPDLVTSGTLELIASIETQFLRTERHPAAVVMPDAQWFDRLYETADVIEDVYESIREAVIRTANSYGVVLYAVPGSPVVAERSVQLLIEDPRVLTVVHPAMSFLDLAWARLGVDPVALGAKLVDGHRFNEVLEEVGEPGALGDCVLVAQCDTKFVLSDIKLASDLPLAETVTVLHHLGLDDETVFSVAWEDLDRSFEPDHLTSLWIEGISTRRVPQENLIRRRFGRP